MIDVIDRKLAVVSRCVLVKENSCHIPFCVNTYSRSRASTDDGRARTGIEPNLVTELLDHAEKLVRCSAKRQRISNDEYQSIVQELDRLELTRSYYRVRNTATFADYASSAEHEKRDCTKREENRNG